MKQTISLIIIMLVCSTLDAQKLSMGTEIGFISSNSTVFSLTDFKHNRNTYYCGLNINYDYCDRLTITTGLHYLKQGYRNWNENFFPGDTAVLKIDYLIIPIALNINFGKSHKIIATLGIYGAYNIQAILDPPGIQLGGYYTANIGKDLSNLYPDYSLGGIIGMGYKIFDNDKLKINSMIKYYLDLKDHPDDYLYAPNYNSVLLTVAISFKILKNHK